MSLHHSLIDALKDLSSAERQLVRALPKMVKASVSPELRAAFADHLEQTRNHVARIEQAFASIDEKPRATPCKAMQALVAEGAEHIEKDAGDLLGDLALIGSGQRVEHYEIAAYSSAITLAKALRYAEAANLLTQNLQEERRASQLLTKLAGPMLEAAATAE